MPFAIPRIWREPINHQDDCYFCMVDISKFKKVGDRMNISYPSIPSSIAPVSHCELLIPSPPSFDQQSEDQPSVWDMNDDPDYNEDISSKSPHFPSQKEINYLIRDLGLTKSNAELLTSRLQEWNLLDPSCKITVYKKGISLLRLILHLLHPILYGTVLMCMDFFAKLALSIIQIIGVCSLTAQQQV